MKNAAVVWPSVAEALHYVTCLWRGASNLASWFLVSATHITWGVFNNLSEPHCWRKYFCINKGGKETFKLNAVMKGENVFQYWKGKCFSWHMELCGVESRPGKQYGPPQGPHAPGVLSSWEHSPICQSHDILNQFAHSSKWHSGSCSFLIDQPKGQGSTVQESSTQRRRLPDRLGLGRWGRLCKVKSREQHSWQSEQRMQRRGHDKYDISLGLCLTLLTFLSIPSYLPWDSPTDMQSGVVSLASWGHRGLVSTNLVDSESQASLSRKQSKCPFQPDHVLLIANKHVSTQTEEVLLIRM